MQSKSKWSDFFTLYHVNTVVVGSGAAGYNAASRLVQYGQSNVALVTDNINWGTSRNAGSDKQTYYKLTQSGETKDSVNEMAQALMNGGAVDGDTALCEAALSSQCFYHLVELGVEFPNSRYGEYVGYQTDHDLCGRGTSSGPYTSKSMTKVLEKRVIDSGVPIYPNLQCIKLLQVDDICRGILCINTRATNTKDRYVVFNATNVIFATGGPASIYADTVYPVGHCGANGVAFDAGVVGKNLTEWQFGLSSIQPRWNVSGSYMQVVPKFVSVNEDGGDEREFLTEYLDEAAIWEKVFLKGYQWPFDVNKIINGSSIIDILIYIETKLRGRRVFLDFRTNPLGRIPDEDIISKECVTYLKSVHALSGTPVERLKIMNYPAYAYYMDHDIDLNTDLLEIALCAQHNNGGIGGNLWWESNVQGFFSVGEANGSHGVYRPGGSALNAGQVGSLRAAQYIIANRNHPPVDKHNFYAMCSDQIFNIVQLEEVCRGTSSNVETVWDMVTAEMSRTASILRDKEELQKSLGLISDVREHFEDRVQYLEEHELPKIYRLRDILTAQYVYLTAMLDYSNKFGTSRGSYLCVSEKGAKPFPYLPNQFTYVLDEGEHDGLIQEAICKKDGCCEITWRAVRPLPTEKNIFENVWKNYRVNKNIF